MATKKEKLKFYRIIANPSYISTSQGRTVTGYINRHNEFSKWDIEPLDKGEVSTLIYTPDLFGPAPKHFFEMFPPYNRLEFVIDGLSELYNRSIHDLDTLSSKIYVLKSSAKQMYGYPVNNDGSTNTRKLYLDPSTILVGSPNSPQASVTFYVNPTNIRITKQKLFQQLRTRAGWAFQHWGPQIGEIAIDGLTGNISASPKIVIGSVLGLPILPQTVEEIPTEQNSPALAGFRELERWYDEDQNEAAQINRSLIALEYRSRIYVGHFAVFTYEERAESPFMLKYSIKFLVHYDTGDLASATTRARSQIISNTETLDYIRQLKDNS